MWIRAVTLSLCNSYEVSALGTSEVHALARLEQATGAISRELRVSWRPVIFEPIGSATTTTLDAMMDAGRNDSF